MELYANLRIIRKHWWLVVLTTLVAAVGAAGLDHLRHSRTVWVSTATIVLNPDVPNRALVGASSNLQLNSGQRVDLPTLASTYDAYFVSTDFAKRVIQKYNLPMTPAQLTANTSTQLVPGTLLYQISVTSYVKSQTHDAAQDLALTFIDDDYQYIKNLQALNQQTGTNQPLYQAIYQYWSQRTAALEQQLVTAYNDKTMSAGQKYNRIISLQSQLSSLLAQQTKALALAGPQQGTTSAQPQQQQVNTEPAATYFGATLPSVLVRSLLIRNIVLFAALGGFIIGVALALLREYLDASLRSAEEAMEVLSLPVLATIGLFRRVAGRGLPGFSGAQRPPTSQAGREAGSSLVTLSNPFHSASEAFRNLRTGILFAGATRKIRTIVVTSAMPGEGKSTVAANLAIVMAQAGERVILVDADMRRPQQHIMFGLSSTSGLSTLYLTDEADLRPAITSALQPTAIPNLRLFEAGQVAPNPAELLASARTTTIVEALKEQADLVIFDTPAMGLLTDAVILAAHSDGTLMVIRSRTTRRDVVKTALAKLASVNARVLGVVLNMADAPRTSYPGYYRRRGRRSPWGSIFAPKPRTTAPIMLHGAAGAAPPDGPDAGDTNTALGGTIQRR